MKNIKIYLILTVAILTSFSPITLAKTYNAEELSEFAEKFLIDNLPKPPVGTLDVDVSLLDPRIKIHPCEVPLQINIPEKDYSRNVNIQISCEGVEPWDIYLPTKINTIVPLVVAKYSISKGTVLSADNLRIKHQNINNIRGSIINDIEQISGAKAKRNISKNKAVTLKYICYVCKGENVTIIAQSDSLHIKTMGIALNSGAIGDTVRVKNIKSGKTVFAEVKNINEVIINL